MSPAGQDNFAPGKRAAFARYARPGQCKSRDSHSGRWQTSAQEILLQYYVLSLRFRGCEDEHCLF